MTYRSRQHLDLIHDVPCMCRFVHGCEGLSEPMHGNDLLLGRGASFKAPDWAVAAGCHDAHDYIDGRKGMWTKDEKRAEWWRAFVATQNWLFENRRLIVNKEAA
jgi:hypothetical protein